MVQCVNCLLVRSYVYFQDLLPENIVKCPTVSLLDFPKEQLFLFQM